MMSAPPPRHRQLGWHTCARWAPLIVTVSALAAAWPELGRELQATATGILPILDCQSLGPVLCTLVPDESTATVTGMSLTSNS